MNTWQYVLLLVSVLFGAPFVHWLITRHTINEAWGGSLSLIIDDDMMLPVSHHGTFILPSSDVTISGLVLHGVPIGRIPFMETRFIMNDLHELALMRGQDVYRNVANKGDVRFRFTRLVRCQAEFDLRFVTHRAVHNTLGFYKRALSYDGGSYFESVLSIKWPKESVPQQID